MSDTAGHNEKPGGLQVRPSIIKPARLQIHNREMAPASTAALEDDEAESKKPRLEENPLDDKTSTYYLSDEEDMGEDEPFTLVTYKKKRAEGIPVVFRPTAEGASFWKVNPNRVSAEVVSAAKEKVQSFRTTRDGSFSVSVASLSSAKRLLMLSNVGGLEVKPFIPESYTRNVGKVKHVPLQYSDEQLLEYLRDAGVISARRQIKYYRQEDGGVTTRPLHSVILTFRDDRPIPGRIYLGFTSHPVEEYLGPALRCYNCQRFGHMAKSCRNTRRCKICSEEHHHKECKSVLQPKCANCAGNHAASYSGCPQSKAAAKMRRHELIHGRKPRPNEPSPNLEIVHPVRDPPQRPPQQQPTSTPREPPRETPRAHSRDHSREVPSSNPTYASKLRTPTGPLPESSKTDSASVRPNYNIETSRHSQQASENQPFNGDRASASVMQLILPMLFAALKAILSALPEANNLPEVKALLPLEALLCQQSGSNLRQVTYE